MRINIPNLQGHVMVFSIKERDIWEEDKNYYLGIGYPTAIAEQRAYDHLYVNRRAN